MWGKLWGISVSPGDPEWLTLKGLSILKSVPIVAMPQNRQGQPGMAYQIVREFLQPQQKLMPLKMPFECDRDLLKKAWQAAVSELIPYLKNGSDVAFVSEGDVSFFSTFSYIAQTLHDRQPQVQIEAIPGVCSPLAAAAALNTPLSIWDEKVAILPAIHNLEELETALNWAEVVVLMKVGSVFQQVWQVLAARNLCDRTSLVEWVGWDKQKIYKNILNLKQYRPPYFSIVIIRKNQSLLQ